VYRSGPSTAQIAAARLAAQQKARAAKLREQRAKAAKAKRLAAKAKEEALERKRAEEELRREDEAEARRAAGGTTTGTDEPRRPAAGFASDGESSSKTAPLVGIAFLLALVVLTLGLVPAYLVPWYSMSMVLEEHRQQFTWVGGMAVLATGILLLMVVLGG
jgi:Flp pilus assembly protein TadB